MPDKTDKQLVEQTLIRNTKRLSPYEPGMENIIVHLPSLVPQILSLLSSARKEAKLDEHRYFSGARETLRDIELIKDWQEQRVNKLLSELEEKREQDE